MCQDTLQIKRCLDRHMPNTRSTRDVASFGGKNLPTDFALINDLWDALRSLVGKEAALAIAGGIILVGGYLLKKTWDGVRWTYDYFLRRSRALNDVARDRSSIWPREGNGIWLAQPIEPPKIANFDYAIPGPHVLIVANAKGGVGKTTVSANLAACLSETTPKPVLLIDLDFQGSLSSMSIVGQKDWVPPDGRDSEATYLISGDSSVKQIAGLNKNATIMRGTQTISAVHNLKIVTAYYDLAQAENRLMIEWLLSDRKADLRFRLMELLHSNAVRDAFSLIVLDCPPRFTTGAIMALAAGTHLLVPTILDGPSSEAVLTFVRQVETFRKAGLCRHIKHIGVVGMMVAGAANVASQERILDQRLADSWDEGGTGGVTKRLPSSTYIPESTKFSKASGQGIAYLSMGDAQDTVAVKSAIRELATVVKQEMRL